MNPAEIAPSLDQLRGLHLPGEPPGRFRARSSRRRRSVLAALLVGLVRYLRGRARASLRRAALAELAGSRDLDPESRLVAQARLLRRLARTLAGDAAVRETGAAWATRLDTLLATDFFTKGPGRVLADGLYRRQEPDLDGLDAELGRLIGRLRT
ncbi:hypothetical protein MBRA_02349 [Methylobacterium brachiatum]|nr:hypothetical protein MBRA_02349 [Methylobacterium brachiatum]